MAERYVYSFIDTSNRRKAEKELNRALQEGWEYVELRLASSFFGHHYIIVVRRPA